MLVKNRLRILKIKMDQETVEVARNVFTNDNLATLVQTGYIVTGIIGILGGSIGYLLGRKTSQEPITDSTKRAEAEARKLEAANIIKLKEMEYAESVKKDARETDRQRLQRQWDVEDNERAYKRDLEQRAADETSSTKERDLKLKLAETLLSLKPVLIDYIESVRRASLVYEERRQAYREELVKDYQQKNQGELFEIDHGDADGIIRDLVDMKFPESEKPKIPELPQELRYLMQQIIPEEVEE